MLGNYKLGRILGHGAYAFVRSGYLLDNPKQQFAIKVYEKSKLVDPMKQKAV